MEVKISQLLKPGHICLDLQATDKAAAIRELTALADASIVSDQEGLLTCLFEREKLETTGIGDGIALPHGRTDAVSETLLLFGRSTKGIDFQSLDDQPVNLLFLIAAPKNESTKVLKMLAKVSRLLSNANLRQALLTTENPQEIVSLFQEKEG